MSLNQPSVAVVIIHWNKRLLLEQFLPSVLASTYENLQIIVADNASTDDSVAFLQSNYPQVKVVQLSENFGYAGGYNEALKWVQADYYILLNNDVEVSPNWIEPVISWMESDPKIAAAQPKLLQYNNRNYFEYAGAAGGYIDHLGYIFCRGRLFENMEIDKGQYDDNVPVFWASGACLFVRAKAFHEVGGFDEHFFAHMEEVDLCWRLQLAGYQNWYVGNSTVYHLGGSTLQQGNPKKTYLNFRNSLQMLLKNSATSTLFWLIPVRSTLDLLSSFYFIKNRNFKDSKAVHLAHSHFFFKWGKWWKKRKTVAPQKSVKNLYGVYPKSIVFAHFLGKIGQFNALPNVAEFIGLNQHKLTKKTE
jgi:GT2 family glycosyltransferase